jgi:hypothetical protein
VIVDLLAPDDQRNVALSQDADLLLFASGSGTSYDLFSSVRTAGTFGARVALSAEINTADLETDPFLSSDGRTLYFARLVSGEFRTFQATLGPNGFASPTVIPGLENRSARYPVVSADGKTILFHDNATGTFSARRSDASSAFGNVTSFPDIEAAAVVTSISPDNCRVYFSSSRAGGVGRGDLWMLARRP